MTLIIFKIQACNVQRLRCLRLRKFVANQLNNVGLNILGNVRRIWLRPCGCPVGFPYCPPVVQMTVSSVKLSCLSEWDLLQLINFILMAAYSVQYIYLWFYVFWLIPHFWYWYMVSSDKELDVLCWKAISIFVTVLLATFTNIETVQYRGRQRRSSFW